MSAPAFRLGPVTLTGHFVRLEPLSPSHVEGLWAAAQDARIWSWLATPIASAADAHAFVETALAAERAGTEHAFAVIDAAEGRVVGSTRFMDVTPVARGVEIGWTWYAPDVWGTKVNPEAKLLLMKHAFETHAAIRVCLKTDELNQRSRAAIAKLGAQFEGITRNHRIRRDGSYRGSAVYSVIESEWPAVKSGLVARLAAPLVA
ncbi:MAG TPA: GNAT family N-acetyltransferase [Polyangia bacterium]